MSETYGAARELLERAEADAARIRADADRYRRQREQEAELLVAKARRLLAVAEQRAASISQTAGSAHGRPPPTDSQVVDLGGRRGRRGRRRRGRRRARCPPGSTACCQSAIARAFDGSFHLGV